MVDSHRQAIRYLYSLQGRGMKLGLTNIRVLLRRAGDPHRSFPSIHVAGTNGKGSTCSFLASVLHEAGYSVGLYTSPHLVRFTERVRINGKEMPEERIPHYVNLLKPAIEETRSTFFEATTCLALRYFADSGVDIAVLETGLGGRLDATNAVSPILSVITTISLDHTDILGLSLRSIAREKGGIIKEGTPCVVAAEDIEVLGVLTKIAEQKSAPLYPVRRVVSAKMPSNGSRAVLFRPAGGRAFTAELGLRGSHQIRNALAAVASLEILKKRHSAFSGLKRSAVQKGLTKVVKNTGIRGRFEIVKGSPKMLLDVAHNPGGMRVLAQTLRESAVRWEVMVFGVMEDKDYAEMIGILRGSVRMIITVEAATPRSLKESRLRAAVREREIPVVKGGTVPAGIRTACRIAGDGAGVVITGSHYVVGEALRFLMRKSA